MKSGKTQEGEKLEEEWNSTKKSVEKMGSSGKRGMSPMQRAVQVAMATMEKEAQNSRQLLRTGSQQAYVGKTGLLAKITSSQLPNSSLLVKRPIANSRVNRPRTKELSAHDTSIDPSGDDSTLQSFKPASLSLQHKKIQPSNDSLPMTPSAETSKQLSNIKMMIKKLLKGDQPQPGNSSTAKPSNNISQIDRNPSPAPLMSSMLANNVQTGRGMFFETKQNPDTAGPIVFNPLKARSRDSSLQETVFLRFLCHLRKIIRA